MLLTVVAPSPLLRSSPCSMDEDGAGNRTPPRARSPDAHALAARLPPSRFAAEAAATKAGASAAAVQPVTPAVPKPLSVGFVSPLAGGEDSLPASFDSMSLNDSPEGPAGVGAASMAASSFAGPQSYAPSARGTGGKPSTQRSSGRSRKLRSRRKLAIGSRLLKLTTQVRLRPACTSMPCSSLAAIPRWAAMSGTAHAGNSQALAAP